MRSPLAVRRALRRLGSSLVAITFAMPADADGPPSRWERVRDPHAGEVYALHVEVQRRLSISDRFGLSESQALAARARLELAHADTSPDARLRFDLGFAHFVLRDYARAESVLAAALEFAPSHPAAEDAWVRLAFACGHLGHHACEQRAYEHVLASVTEEPLRATPTLNLAETAMHLGDLRGAIEGYREALRLGSLARWRDSVPLAMWGLAVALDRSGDRSAAEREARSALEIERSSGYRQLLRSENVFFVPSYEVYWYEGLGAVAQARVATSVGEAVRGFRFAEQAFAAYVSAAERDPVPDRWLPLARLRLESVRSLRRDAENRLEAERGRKSSIPARDEDIDL